MPDRHALLGPSSAHRWLACPPSARLGEGCGDTGSIYAEEGTLAHKLAELILRQKFEGAEIAAELGFENVSQFSAFFRQREKITATQYRSKYGF